MTPAERAELATWITPRQLALFNTMHVADQRHGIDVVVSLRDAGVEDREALLAGLLHDAGKGSTGVWPRVAYALADEPHPRHATAEPALSPPSSSEAYGLKPTRWLERAGLS